MVAPDPVEAELLVRQGALHDLVRPGGRQLGEQPHERRPPLGSDRRPGVEPRARTPSGSKLEASGDHQAAITWSPASSSGTP